MSAACRAQHPPLRYPCRRSGRVAARALGPPAALGTARAHSGQAAVEFALVLPLLLTLFLGVVEFSVLLYDKAMLTNASREGARAGIVSQSPRVTDSEIRTIVTNYCGAHLLSLGGASAPSTSIARTGTAFGDDLTVLVDYDYRWLCLPNFVAEMAGLSALRLRSTSVMKYE